jgi:hypothetical protein
MVMGTLFYGSSGMQVGFDDRTLAHLQLVLGAKLRLGERFFFSWTDHADSGSGRSALWMETAIPIYFHYSSARPVAINRAWLDILATTADQPGGLKCLPEPGTAADRTMLPHSRV